LLREWLRDHVHRYGRKLDSAEIVERATGRPIEIGPYVRYLTEKYGAIYELDAAPRAAAHTA
jgi:carboxypeptidase Taq